MKEMNVSQESQDEKMVVHFKWTTFPVPISRIPKAKQMGNLLSICP